jgi:hypothetical protein
VSQEFDLGEVETDEGEVSRILKEAKMANSMF